MSSANSKAGLPGQLKNLRVYCADVGSISRGNFAWASKAARGRQTNGSRSIEELAKAVSDDLARERPVALGFECPLSIPIPVEARALGRARGGEEDRPWSSGAGVATLGTGLAQLSWVMRKIRESQGTRRIPVLTGWEEFEKTSGARLLLWEAFVTKSGKPKPGKGQDQHEADAREAVEAFLEKARTNRTEEDGFGTVLEVEEPLLLIGVAAIWSGLTTKTSLLREECIVIRTDR